MPKPRHCRPPRLLHLLGSSFDPFWMSIDPPLQKGRSQSYTSYKEKLNSSLELKGAAANRRQMLENEAADLDLGLLSSDVAVSVRAWMLDSAVCKLHHRWADLGPFFWPRRLRQTDCGGADVEPSCSFPSGMRCVRAQTARVWILAWHCLEIRDESDESRRIGGEKSDSKTELVTRFMSCGHFVCVFL
ncbi:noggin-3-like [Nothobranchius furzeri]|uniref:Noggin-3-like n=1 Tax=Nothobranchius furzeri TaxID=105023 RepID=A0A9D2Y9D3_NOTFU|nr:noggin-3-like [Nothobranchius furzeri]